MSFVQKGTMAKKCFGILRRAFNYDMRKNEEKTTHKYIRIGWGQ